MKSSLAVGATLWLLFASGAGADFPGLVVEEDTLGLDRVTPLVDIPGYAGERVFNVYAQLDSPTDQCVGVVGTPTHAFNVFTLGGSGFINHQLFGGDVDQPPAQGATSVVPALNWDSFLTIGLFSIGPGSAHPSFTDQVIKAPGTPGPNTDPWPKNPSTGINMAWTVPPTIDGVPTPQSVAGNFPGNRVLIMRLVVEQGEEVTGTMGLLIFDDGIGQEVGASFASGNLGACCFDGPPRRDCLVATEAECSEVIGGVFLGVGTGCPTQTIVTPIHGGGQWSHEIETVSLCPEPGGGQAPCVAGGAHIDPWTTTDSGSGFNCENFGHPDACPIPAGFFGPGSDAYAGVICFQGEPIGPVMLSGFDEELDFGAADTLVRRLEDPFERCAVPSSRPATVAIAVERLNLVSVSPLIVTFNGGQSPQPWNVRVQVLDSVGQPGGTLTATKTSCNGGMFDSVLAVCPTFLFTRVSDGMELELDFCAACDSAGIVMTASGVAWVHDVQGGVGAVNPVCSDFHPGIAEDEGEGPPEECDCNGNGVRDQCDLEGKLSRDCDGDNVPDECQAGYCAADVSCDGMVHLDDLMAVLENWGCTGGCAGDANLDGAVNVGDLSEVIVNWGPCP